jgi:hypothetical protein
MYQRYRTFTKKIIEVFYRCHVVQEKTYTSYLISKKYNQIIIISPANFVTKDGQTYLINFESCFEVQEDSNQFTNESLAFDSSTCHPLHSKSTTQYRLADKHCAHQTDFIQWITLMVNFGLIPNYSDKKTENRDPRIDITNNVDVALRYYKYRNDLYNNLQSRENYHWFNEQLNVASLLDTLTTKRRQIIKDILNGKQIAEYLFQNPLYQSTDETLVHQLQKMHLGLLPDSANMTHEEFIKQLINISDQQRNTYKT